MKEPLLPIRYENGAAILLDQTKLPLEETFYAVHTADEMADAIKRLAVRGAPAIGIAGAYGICLAANASSARTGGEMMDDLAAAAELLKSSRPTAVNLFYAVDRMTACAHACAGCSAEQLRARLLEEAAAVLKEEEAACKRIGEYALTLLQDGMTLLTHCNAGGLATIRYGTALAPMLLGAERGIRFKVYADETRPLLQGARLTAWELQRAGVDVTLITDSMAGTLMRQGKIDAVITGSDRIAANGDFANKIGTYSAAVLAKYHNIPFYVAAPFSTVDMNTSSGEGIVIEQRDPAEVTEGFGKRTAPEGIKVYNPAFDVTPGELAAAIITDRGVLRPPYAQSLKMAMEGEPYDPAERA